MRYTELPPSQGLYDPSFEHDACGMGFVAHLKGVKSHQIVQQALKVLTHMEHRGACGCEENTGDGAGILIQLPHEFLVAECKSLNIKLPAPGHYAAGMVFLPQDADARADVASLFARIVEEEGQTLLGWRDVPVNPTPIGKTALKAMPFIRMVFIAKAAEVADRH